MLIKIESLITCRFMPFVFYIDSCSLLVQKTKRETSRKQGIGLMTHHAKSQFSSAWWRHQMETFSALLAICAGTSPVPGEFPSQRPVTRSFDVYFDLRPNKRLSKQSLGWWFDTLSPPLWRHRNDEAWDMAATQYLTRGLTLPDVIKFSFTILTPPLLIKCGGDDIKITCFRQNGAFSFVHIWAQNEIIFRGRTVIRTFIA